VTWSADDVLSRHDPQCGHLSYRHLTDNVTSSNLNYKLKDQLFAPYLVWLEKVPD